MTTPDGKVMNLRQDSEEKFIELDKRFEASIEKAVCEFPNHGEIVAELLKYPHEPEKILEKCRINPGIPVKP